MHSLVVIAFQKKECNCIDSPRILMYEYKQGQKSYQALWRPKPDVCGQLEDKIENIQSQYLAQKKKFLNLLLPR